MIADLMNRLGPGAEISYLGYERGAWHCDIKLPRLHYTVVLVTASGEDADAALRNTVERAVTLFARKRKAVAA